MEFLTHCPSSRSRGPLQSRAWEVLSWVWERKVCLVQRALALNGDPWKPRQRPVPMAHGGAIFALFSWVLCIPSAFRLSNLHSFAGLCSA